MDIFLICSNFSPELGAGQQGPAQDAVRLYPEPSPVQLIVWEIKVGADRIFGQGCADLQGEPFSSTLREGLEEGNVKLK